jgi:PrtD family type I secretion system ABC transporter
MAKSIASAPAFAQFLRRCRWALVGVAALSAMANLLALTGSLYMLQVYDRVLPSRSIPTLVGLTVLMIGLYSAFGVLDLLRGRVMRGLAIRLDRQLREPVFQATLRLPFERGDHKTALQPIRDLDQIRSFLAGPGPIALIDMPWLPFYLALVFLLHPLLGLLATAGAMVLVAFTALTELRSRKPAQSSTLATGTRQSFMEAMHRNAELVRALGLERRMAGRWDAQSEAFIAAQRRALSVTSGLGAASRVFRMVLQSALLGLGAYVVIRGEATGGVMIATSVLTSRALAPIESAIANWRSFIGARQSRARLGNVLTSMPAEAAPLALPAPKRCVMVEELTVAAPGERKPILHGVAFTLQAGEGLGVIGPSASGKSTLARSLVGAWPVQRGAIRLDGAALDQWDRGALGRHIGYLPQDIALLDGTIAENIARLEENAPSEAVIAAARAAGVHEMILKLPDGYGANVGQGGAVLSGGQRQRIALARALYGNPFFVVLDEPNANLDAQGDAALTEAIAGVRARGGIVVVIAHRPAALSAVDKLAVLGGCQLQAFGPKEEVLAKVIQPVGVARMPASLALRQGDAA